MKSHHLFKYTNTFNLETGGKLDGFELAYTTLGVLNKERSNAIWVVHALTGSGDVTAWWPGLFEKGSPLDPSKYFIICANAPGGCYGSTGPLSVNPLTKEPYYHDFPSVTNRDVVRAFDLLREELGLQRIHTVIGSSLGGQQALEWSLLQPEVFNNLILIACNAFHSPWGIAWNEAQRMAIEADPTWSQPSKQAGANGMKAARAMAMLSYRSYEGYRIRQTDDQPRLEGFRSASYQRYQGEKLSHRFNAFTYQIFSRAMDSHHVGRNRGEVKDVLRQVKSKTLVIGIETDVLFPPSEQEFLAAHIPGARIEMIQSQFGHDGFLVEFEQLNNVLRKFYQEQPSIILS